MESFTARDLPGGNSPAQNFSHRCPIFSKKKLSTYQKVGNFVIMDTRTQIIQLGDSLIREKGYNAFSFSDISKELNIRNASVHYHFPTKTALGIAVIHHQLNRIEKLQIQTNDKNPIEKLKAFMTIYSRANSENKVCIIGALATDLYTVEPAMQTEIKKLAAYILKWITGILQEGEKKGLFNFSVPVRTKALLIIANMLASLQLTRLTNDNDFRDIKQYVLNDLLQKKL